jgi:hypothetical protein
MTYPTEGHDDEIERLRVQALGNQRRMQNQGLEMMELWETIHALTDERDEARRIACTYISGTYSKNNVMINRVSAMAEAARRGWDCYKENKR